MRIVVDLTEANPTVELRDADDFKGFKVVARGSGAETKRLAETLAPVGEIVGDGDAFIRVDALKRLAGPRSEEREWLASLEGMLDYAGSHGWLSEDGSSIRAHYEWESANA